eukprot:9143052-Heterocapsa_arctica.AAC.1
MGNLQIFTLEYMINTKNYAIVCNIGHFDNEIDTADVKNTVAIKMQNIKLHMDRFVFPDDHGVIILTSGCPMNLGCAMNY